MAVNKVVLGNETLVDLTDDTVTASDVISGRSFHLASGVQSTGSLSTATQSADGLMSSTDKTKLDGIATGATANTGTVTSIATGAGLTGGTITDSGTIKVKLVSETESVLTAHDPYYIAEREYAIGLDADGNLAVNVPWSDTTNTAGASNYSGQLYLVGALSQSSTSATATRNTAYIGTDGCLYSGGVKVSTLSYTEVGTFT